MVFKTCEEFRKTKVVTMARVLENLLTLLVLKVCLLLNDFHSTCAVKNNTVSREENSTKRFIATNLQCCEGGVIRINVTSCNKYVTLRRSANRAKLVSTRLKLGPRYQKKYFICDNTTSYDISMSSTAIPTKDWGCITLNLSKSWFSKNNLAHRIEYISRNASKECILLACVTLLPNPDSKMQTAFYISHTYYTICEKYNFPEVAFALSGFLIVLSLFALFHDAVLMRIVIFLVMIILCLVLSENSWMYLSFLLVFILVFIFTGATTRARFTKSFIFFMQTYTAMLPELTLFLSKLYTLLRFNSLHFTTMPCIFPESLIHSTNSSWNNSICTFCAPLIALFIILCFILLKKLLEVCVRRPRNAISLNRQFAFALVFVGYYSFFNSSKLAFTIFRTYQFNSKEYSLGIAGLTIFGMLPIAVFTYLLYIYRNNLNDERVTSWLGYIYKSYRQENHSGQKRWQYYEIYFMLFRLILASILTLVKKDWKYFLLIAVLLLMAIFYYKVTPFTDIWANFVALVPIFSLIIISAILYAFVHRKEPLSTSAIEPDLISVVFLVTTGFFIRIIVPRDWRQKFIDCCKGNRRSMENTEASRRLLTDGTTNENAGYGSVRVIANLIEEYRGAEVHEENVHEQSSNHSHAEQSEEENNAQNIVTI